MNSDSFWHKLVAFLLLVIAIMLAIIIYDSHVDKHSDSGLTSATTEPIRSETDTPKTFIEHDSVIAEPAPEPEAESMNDYKWARVQGPVKSIRETIITIETYSKDTVYKSLNFDRNGIIIPKKQKNTTIKYTRDSQGQIIKIVEKEKDTETWMEEPNGEVMHNTDVDIYTYKYNDSGYVTYEYQKHLSDFYDTNTDEFYYTVNNKGWIVSSKWICVGDGTFNIRSNYTYSNEDRYGNWLKAVIKVKSTSNCCGSDQYQQIITRKITYWE